MSKTSLALVLASAATLVAACTNASSTSTDAENTAAASMSGVAALIEDWSSAGAQGRWGDLKALYADEPGFAWIEQGRVAYQDHASVVAGVDQAAAMGAAIESTVADVAVTPLSRDAAAFHARSTINFTAPTFSFAFDGVLSGVAVKRGDRWLFLHGHLSALAPPPDASADSARDAPPR